MWSNVLRFIIPHELINAFAITSCYPLRTDKRISIFTDCPSQTVQYADLIFVLDSSASITQIWPAMRNFVINIINQIHIGPQNVRVGMVQFSDTAEVEISLGQFENENELVNAISRVQPISLNTNLRAAMEVTAEQFEKIGADRSGANDIVIILTDAGNTATNQATERAIDRLKQTGEGVYMIPIGVSDDVDLVLLQKLANNASVPPSTPIRDVDFFWDIDLRDAPNTIEKLFNRRLTNLLEPICDVLRPSSKSHAIKNYLFITTLRARSILRPEHLY